MFEAGGLALGQFNGAKMVVRQRFNQVNGDQQSACEGYQEEFQLQCQVLCLQCLACLHVWLGYF